MVIPWQCSWRLNKIVMAKPLKRQPWDRVFCHHCHKYLPKSMFYPHKETYFSHVSGEWQQKNHNSVSRAKEVAQCAPSDHSVMSGACSSNAGDDTEWESQGSAITGSWEHEGRFFQMLQWKQVCRWCMNRYKFHIQILNSAAHDPPPRCLQVNQKTTTAK